MIKREESHCVRRSLDGDGRKLREKPERMWRGCIGEDMRKKVLSESDTKGWSEWKQKIRNTNSELEKLKKET